MTRRKSEPCANCHENPRETLMLCGLCRIRADELIEELPAMYDLATGTGPWDMILVPKPRDRVAGSIAGLKY